MIGKVGTWAYIVHYRQPFAFYLILLHLFFFVNTSARTYDLVDVGDCKEVVHIQLKKTIEFIKYQKF